MGTGQSGHSMVLHTQQTCPSNSRSWGPRTDNWLGSCQLFPTSQHESAAVNHTLCRTLGKMPPKKGCRLGSCSLALSSMRPMSSLSAWNRILMKMRLLEVVSSSVRRMLLSTPQEMPSEYSRCCRIDSRRE